jgi:hypothetical protein
MPDMARAAPGWAAFTTTERGNVRMRASTARGAPCRCPLPEQDCGHASGIHEMTPRVAPRMRFT